MGIYLRRKVWFMSYTDENDRRRRVTTGATSKTEANSIYASTITKVREGKHFDIRKAERLTLNQLAMKVAKKEKGHTEPYGCYFWDACKPLLKELGSLFLAEIDVEKIEGYQTLRLKTVGKHTVNKEVGMLRKLFNQAIRWKQAIDSPVKDVKFFKIPKGRIRFLENDEQVLLLATCTGWLRDIVLLALRTGMRTAELIGLRKVDLDFGRRQINLTSTKTGLQRQIPMVPEIETLLKRLVLWKGDDGYVFTKKNGSRRKAVKGAWNIALKNTGIKNFCFHDLRHTYASDMVSAGVDVFALSKYLGHASVSTTMIYAHLSPEHSAREMEKYNSMLERRMSQM